MSHWIAFAIICLVNQHTAFTTTDPELLEQLWIQLYRFLPGPSVSPQLPSELLISVDVSVSLDNVELVRSHNGLACKASLTILAEWPVTDARVADSRLVELMTGGVRLDVNRVWHPELIIPGSFRVQQLSQRLELRMSTRNPESNTKSQKSPSLLNRSNLAAKTQSTGSSRIQSNFVQQELTDEISTQATRGSNRPGVFQVSSGAEGPRYVYMESLAVEVTCDQPKRLGQVATALCPILIRQGGLMYVQPNIKWAERKSCLISDNVKRRLSHVTLTKLFGQHIDRQGADHSLGVNICFPQTNRVLQSCLIPLIIVTISLLILWTGPIGAPVITWLQLTLMLVVAVFWIWFNEQDGKLGLLDIWILFCLVFTGLTSCLAIGEQRWLTRMLKQRRRRLIRSPSLSLMKNKTNAVSGTTVLNVNPGTGACCFQGFTCGSSSGTCHENCVNCAGLQGCTGGGFVSPNGTTGAYCNNSSCGASGHACSGMVNHVSRNSAGNSPAPMGFSPQQIGIGEAKMDTYHDGYLCSVANESRNGGTNNTFRGLRWRNLITVSRQNNNATDLSGLETPDCQVCSCRAPSHQTDIQPCSPAPPYASNCSSMSFTVQTNRCLTGLKIAFIVSFVLIGAIFWISVLALGTVPEACLGTSVCQPIVEDHLK